MAVHDLGYRGWSGIQAPSWGPTIAVASFGVRCAWQSRWLRRMVFLAWLPTVWFALGFFIWEQSLLYQDWQEGIRPFLQGAPPNLRVLLDNANGMGSARHSVWAWLLQTFFRYPQGFLMVLVVGQIAPRLISQDIRSGAFHLYFSRPVTRSEYILAKFLTVWFYLALISTLPALALYMGGVLLSPQFDVLLATWDLPLRILAASALLAVPTAAVALSFSAMTQESRYAGFAWFAIWVLGWVAYGVMTSAGLASGASQGFDEISPWTNVSPYHLLGNLQTWVFGFDDFADVRWSALILAIVTVVSLAILYRRVSAPMRV